MNRAPPLPPSLGPRRAGPRRARIRLSDGGRRPAGRPARAKDTILVVVEMTGGNDGLNTVVPFTDPNYAKLRPVLKLPTEQLKKIDKDLGMHPSLAGFAKLLEAGNLCVVQGVGYPNPDQSHFRSMDIWQLGSTDPKAAEGWLGRSLKAMPAGTQSFHIKAANQSAPLAYEGAPIASRPSPHSPNSSSRPPRPARRTAAQQKIIEGAVGGAKKPGLLDFVSRTASNTYASSRRLAEVGKTYTPKVAVPRDQPRQPPEARRPTDRRGAGVAGLLRLHRNFDTHATQMPSHANLLAELGGAMTAFFDDMKARGQGDRVLMMTFSEFGRPKGERQQGHRPRLGVPDVSCRRQGQGRRRRQASQPDRPAAGQPRPPHRLPPGVRRRPRQVARRAEQGRPGRGVRAGGRAEGVSVWCTSGFEPDPVSGSKA